MRASPSARSYGPSNDANQPAKRRPIYIVRLQPLPNVDGVRARRAVLKSALRVHGLRTLEAREDER
jgi:hypothetical protein